MMRTLLCWFLCLWAMPVLAAPRLDQISLPKGFHIAVYSDQVPNAREIALAAKGTVFVGSMGAGKVYALTDSKGDVQPMPDGSVLVSNDLAGAVYRVGYQP